MSLVKVNVTNFNYGVYQLLEYIKTHKSKITIDKVLILDAFNRVRVNTLYIPQYFNKVLVFISYTSFQQTDKTLSLKIRSYVNNIINNINEHSIVCIGGESYLYGITNDKIKNIQFYTNCTSIYNDCVCNNKIYKKNVYSKVVNYNYDNDINFYDNYNCCIINLSSLNINLIKNINHNSYMNNRLNKIIIINCHHNDFYKKIKYLSNYKLIERKYFVGKNHYITINTFYKKSNIIVHKKVFEILL